MDKLTREHEFVLAIWKFIKTCETSEKTCQFWQWAQDEAEKIAHNYGNLGFADEWLIYYMKTLDEGSKTCSLSR